ncbi:unnamed protein product [Malus baccata var. baccata]
MVSELRTRYPSIVPMVHYRGVLLELEGLNWRIVIHFIWKDLSQEAMNDEMDSLELNQTWHLVDLPPGCKTIEIRSMERYYKRKSSLISSDNHILNSSPSNLDSSNPIPNSSATSSPIPNSSDPIGDNSTPQQNELKVDLDNLERDPGKRIPMKDYPPNIQDESEEARMAYPRQVDEAHGVSIKKQMTMVLRYVDKDGKVIEKGYNGASNTKGEFNRPKTKTKILNEQPYASYVHCFAHQLQLALVAVAKDNVDVNTFFLLTNNVVNNIEASCKRRDALREMQQKELMKALENDSLMTGQGLNQETSLKRAGATRWNSHYGTLISLIFMYSSVVNVLEMIVDDNTNDSVAEANRFTVGFTLFQDPSSFVQALPEASLKPSKKSFVTSLMSPRTPSFQEGTYFVSNVKSSEKKSLQELKDKPATSDSSSTAM